MQYDLFKNKISKQSIFQYLDSKIKNKELQQVYSDLKNAVKILESLIKHQSLEQKYFFKNYETIIDILHKFKQNQAINLTVHWMNIYGQRLIEINKVEEAKQIYQEFINFQEKKSIDKLALFTGLNNLCILEKSQQNYHKCLQYALKNIKMISDEMKVLKRRKVNKNDQTIFHLAVILVNNFKTSKDCIRKILQNQKKSTFEQQQYLDLFENMNKYGYKTCLTYLGKQSCFAYFFDPVLFQQSKSSIIEFKQSQIIQTEDQQAQQQKVNYDKGQIIDKITIQEKQWKLIIQLSRTYIEKLGNLELSYQNYGQKVKKRSYITQEKLTTIISLINFQDTLPYEYVLQSVPQNKFIYFCILPYLQIQKDGNVCIHPKCKGLLKHFFKYFFFQYQCMISLNHIKGNKFRMSISPLEISQSLYLNIQISQQTIFSLFQQLIDPIPQIIIKEHLNLLKSKEKHMRFNQKTYKIKNQDLFQSILKKILKSFQQFLKNEDQGYGDLLSLIQKDLFYKFIEEDQHKGTFFEINYINSLQNFNIYAQRFYFSQTDNKKNFNKIKGRSMLTREKFSEAFGIQKIDEETRPYLKRFCEIISQKYFLKECKNSFILDQKSYNSLSYNDNLILERSFNFHSFQVEFIHNKQQNNYLSLITVSIVTINNQIPIGIKVSHYDSDNIETKGFFIDISKQDWLKVNFNLKQQKIIKFHSLKNQISMNNKPGLFIKSQDQYPFMKKYFIGQWMETKGFRKILNQVVNQKSQLYIQKNINKIINWTQTIEQEKITKITNNY